MAQKREKTTIPGDSWSISGLSTFSDSSSMRSNCSNLRSLLLLTVILGAACQTGCVHRRMAIESNPVGALVLLDGEEIGYTPISADFTYYGTREVTLVKDGYETQTFSATLQTPWYQRFPLDFFSDNFSPKSITNRHRFFYQLQPKRVDWGSTEDLRQRGDSFRSEALHGL